MNENVIILHVFFCCHASVRTLLLLLLLLFCPSHIIHFLPITLSQHFAYYSMNSSMNVFHMLFYFTNSLKRDFKRGKFHKYTEYNIQREGKLSGICVCACIYTCLIYLYSIYCRLVYITYNLCFYE